MVLWGVVAFCLVKSIVIAVHCPIPLREVKYRYSKSIVAFCKYRIGLVKSSQVKLRDGLVL